ncbi:Unannotated [Lentimonas sp. CC4]|nr:Unannotated [Lentimonas sp. CC4]CAA6687039.1 Unannotated [Lentimonas sp. CC6]CAA7076187.1 Unannotated [Lentimonas sp. CC4]CAA7171164.1 Unannotated [Lentimonas sp. CC21]CAA7182745.1 Unannotated [Lentimonas sp. CC8]
MCELLGEGWPPRRPPSPSTEPQHRASAPTLSTSTPQDEAETSELVHAPPECVERKITILDVRFLPVAIPDRRQAFLLFEGITKMGSVAESG